MRAADLREHPELLESGWWAVVATFEAAITGWQFADVRLHDPAVTSDTPPDDDAPGWHGPPAASWGTSLDAHAYQDAVQAVRTAIREGEVYQANICRLMSAPLGSRRAEPDALALATELERGNPAPYAGLVHIPIGTAQHPCWVVSASPELFLSVRDGRVISAPIKGTGTRPEDLGDKDHAENVMIADLVRNDPPARVPARHGRGPRPLRRRAAPRLISLASGRDAGPAADAGRGRLDP